MDQDRDDILSKEDVAKYFEKNDLPSEDLVVTKDQSIDVVELWLQSRRDETGFREVSVQEIAEIIRDWCGV
ncbi:hypothetical protein Ciccas_009144 [Cichlidogyrus casuarinus]|uniref:EF-hand domain-containing protein n=1 Tax=Cichlidogyrus casuarinus TaxID=1844966 RepID=A0ABD2Q0M9_9PLAT